MRPGSSGWPGWQWFTRPDPARRHPDRPVAEPGVYAESHRRDAVSLVVASKGDAERVAVELEDLVDRNAIRNGRGPDLEIGP